MWCAAAARPIGRWIVITTKFCAPGGRRWRARRERQVIVPPVPPCPSPGPRSVSGPTAANLIASLAERMVTMPSAPVLESRLPVTAKLSKRFYDVLGEEIANELVDWFNAVDLTYRTEPRALNELNFARFD